MKKFIFGLTLALSMCAYSTASASILDFEGLSSGQTPIGNGYGGLNWSNMFVLNPATDIFGTSGYPGGLVSGDNVAFNGGGSAATVSNGTFDFNSVYLAGAWNDGLNVRAQGFLNGNLLYDQTVVTSYATTNGASATLFNFNFLGIDELVFSSFGGTYQGGNGGGTQFVMDDMEINRNNVVPEPGTIVIWTVIAGTGLVCSTRRRRIA